MRIFIGTTEIAGMYRSLAKALRALGHEVTFLPYEPNPFGYGGEDGGWLIDSIRALRGRLQAARARGLTNSCRRVVYRLLIRISEYALLLWATWHCEAFIFGFHQSLLPNLADLPWLRWWGRTVWMQSNGSDVRPPYIDAAACRRSPAPTEAAVRKATTRCRRRVLRAERWATGSIDIPMQGLQRTRPFINWLKIGIVATPSWFPPCYTPPTPSEKVRLLHCPSFPAGKGSVELRAMVTALARELRPRGIEIEYVELTGRPNSEILEALLNTDIVLDQLYADYGMAGFAIEAAWFGRPVVVGGYAADLWRRLLPEAELPPTHYVRPEDFQAEVRRLITDSAMRLESGRRHRQFMDTAWAPAAVAERYLRLLRNDIPSDWWIDVDDALSPFGWGFPQPLLVEYVTRYIQSGGTAALGLDHVPERERRLVAWWTATATNADARDTRHMAAAS